MAEPTLTVHRSTAFVPVTHDQLVDYTDHECDTSCPPPWTPPVIPLKRRVQARLRGIWWRIRRLPGYRIAHKEDIRGWGDDD